MTVCTRCNATVRPEFRFCPSCGATQNRAPDNQPTGFTGLAPNALQRKHVTVLFADLCSSSTHVASVDPEHAKEYLEGALHLMSQAVHAYGGTVSQLLGDGLIALFGAPVAHEDHAIRACLTALEIQKQAHANRRNAQPTAIRIGVHSGEVVVGLTHDDVASFYRADGRTIHLASRIEQLAKPGGILISAATRRLTADRFDTRAIGPTLIRGVTQPLELFVLMPGAAHSVSVSSVQVTEKLPLLGREALLDALADEATRVCGGELRIVGLRGEAGIGKSRVLAEHARAMARGQFTVCAITGKAYASTTPYSALADLACALVGIALDADADQRRDGMRALIADWPADATTHRAVMADMFDIDEATPSSWYELAPAQRLLTTTATVLWLIERRQAAGRLLIIIDDLQFCDRQSLRMLESLIAELRDRAVFVCLGYRPECKPGWEGTAVFAEHLLEALPKIEMRALSQALLGADASLDRVHSTLIERAEGNPFYLEQSVITLVDEGILIGKGGNYRCVRETESFRVPGTIAATIAARVDRLPAMAKAIIEAAAVVAEPMTVTLGAVMLGLSADEASAQLSVCAAAGLMHPTRHHDGTSYRFVHALMQEAIAGSLAMPGRKALHRAACSALHEHSRVAPTDRPSILAHHASHGELWQEAAGFALQAMTRSISRSANRDVLRMFGLGLDAIARIPESMARNRLELRLRLKALGAQLPLGRIDDIVVNLECATGLGESLGDTRRQAGILVQLAVAHWMRGTHRKGLTAVAQALAHASTARHRDVQMSAIQLRMMLNHGLGRYGQVIADGRYLIEQYGAELDTAEFTPGWAVTALANVESFLADALWRVGRTAEAQAECDVAYRALAQRDHVFSRLLVDFTQASIWIIDNQPARATPLLQAMLSLCREQNIVAMQPPVLTLMVGALSLTGHAGEADTMLTKALAGGMDRISSKYDAFYFPKARAIAQAAMGNFDAGIAASQAAREAAASFEHRGQEVEALLLRCGIERAAGMPGAAWTHFSEAATLGRACGIELTTLDALPYWGQPWPYCSPQTRNDPPRSVSPGRSNSNNSSTAE